MKIFLQKALDYCDPTEKDVLVDVYIRCMLEDYGIYMANLSISSFFQVNGAMRGTNEFVERL